MSHSEFHKHADGTVTHKPTDAEIRDQAEAHRADGETIEQAVARFEGLATNGWYIFKPYRAEKHSR